MLNLLIFAVFDVFATAYGINMCINCTFKIYIHLLFQQKIVSFHYLEHFCLFASIQAIFNQSLMSSQQQQQHS